MKHTINGTLNPKPAEASGKVANLAKLAAAVILPSIEFGEKAQGLQEFTRVEGFRGFRV